MNQITLRQEAHRFVLGITQIFSEICLFQKPQEKFAYRAALAALKASALGIVDSFFMFVDHSKMDSRAISIAKSRLRIADDAVNRLLACDDFELFQDIWYQFLTAWKSIYTSLEQGAKTNPQSRQWFGGKKRERKADPLLRYLFQARDDEEHGLARSTKLGRKFLYEIPESDFEGPFHVATDPFELRRGDGGPMRLLQSGPLGPMLVSVTGRGHIEYPAPISHMRQIIDISPIGVARVGITYVAQLIDEAATMITPES